MNPTPFNWSRLITKINDKSSNISPDVIFQIVENDQVHEIKAHKMILAMVSDTFETMFYSTDVGDKAAGVIPVKKTTAPAFQIMIDAVYNTRSVGDSLQGKSVDEVFAVVNLVERYQIKELMEAVKDFLAQYPITDDTVLEVAEDAMEYTNLFEAEANHLLLNCAQFLRDKLKDVNSMLKYATENKDRKEVFGNLMILMNDLEPTKCPNCKKEICQDGQGIKEDEFRVGLTITNNRANGGWPAGDYGTAKVTIVGDSKVTLVPIQPGVNGHQVAGGTTKEYVKIWNPGQTNFLFSCN